MSSHLNNGKFKMEDVLNATLAGGVIIGTPSNMVRSPAASLIIGFCGGLLSTYGFNKVTPFLADRKILHDTCGVLNLHGVPGVLSGLIGVVMAGISEDGDFDVPIGDVFGKRGDPDFRDAGA